MVFFNRTNRCNEKSYGLRILIIALITIMVILQFGLFSSPENLLDASITGRTGTIKVTNPNIRSAPSTSGSIITTLPKGHPITVLDVVEGDYVASYYTKIWFKIEFVWNNTSTQGYILSTLVMLDSIDPKLYVNDIEGYLSAQGFPDTYKSVLLELHKKYPNWIFEAYHTNLDWSVVIEQQHLPGKSLISNRDDGWKSIDNNPRIYNWSTNTWVVHDGSSWVSASRESIAYYMDPRNFLIDERDAFQFEKLNWFDPAVHNAAGLEEVLKNTFMNREINGFGLEYYCNAFLSAANNSKTSPYHLASRARQEVNTWRDGSYQPSPSAMGYFPSDPSYDILRPYEGHYNFFNIGATHSTVLYGNVRNGLERAKFGWATTALNTKYGIPWNSPIKSIQGGAVFIKEGYIDQLQYSNYYQKFNVINNVGSYNLFSHQYMANIEAPYSESRRMHQAYAASGNLNSPIVFSIPVYLNMPDSRSPRPQNTGNPNNWIKTLKVDERNVTPTFDPAKTGTYSIIVDGDVKTARVVADPASSKSRINGAAAGRFTADYPLQIGDNVTELSVVAENGNVRKYTINIVRNDPGTPPVLSSKTLQISDSLIVSGFKPQSNENTVEYLRKNVIVTDESYKIVVLNKNRKPKSDKDTLATGDEIVFERNGNYVDPKYSVLIYGDANGDGEIDTADLNHIFKHVMGREKIEGIYLSASDVSRDGEVDTYDLNIIFRHVMGRDVLKQ